MRLPVKDRIANFGWMYEQERNEKGYHRNAWRVFFAGCVVGGIVVFAICKFTGI